MKTVLYFAVLMILSSCVNTQKLITEKHPQLPEPIGAYNHSVRKGDIVFVSGQIGIDPKTNLLEEGVKEQTIQLLENLKIVLKNNNSDLAHVTKTTIFMTDIKTTQEVNEIYAKYFKNQYPARSTIQVAALPKEALIEIECIAVVK